MHILSLHDSGLCIMGTKYYTALAIKRCKLYFMITLANMDDFNNSFTFIEKKSVNIW